MGLTSCEIDLYVCRNIFESLGQLRKTQIHSCISICVFIYWSNKIDATNPYKFVVLPQKGHQLALRLTTVRFLNRFCNESSHPGVSFVHFGLKISDVNFWPCCLKRTDAS